MTTGETKSIVFPSVDAAWRDTLRIIYEEGLDVAGVRDALSIGSSFGKQPRSFREVIGLTIEILNPRDRLINSSARPINVAYLLGNTVWTFLGSDNVSQIAFYNKRGWNFTDDQETVAAAPGKRIFQSNHGDQFSETARVLRSDPTSRRAVIAIYTPSDTGSLHRDCSCMLTMQFLIRQGKLICVASMRSQSLALVFPYDAFLVSMLHEAMAVSTGIDLGSLFFQYGSLHYYHDETEIVSKILAEELSPIGPMPFMETSPLAAQNFLTSVDSTVRSDRSLSTAMPPDVYWDKFARALVHSIEHRESPAPLPNELDGTWYALLTN